MSHHLLLPIFTENERLDGRMVRGPKRHFSQDFVSSQPFGEIDRIFLMSPEAQTQVGPAVRRVTDEQLHTLVLRAWEAINTERDLRGVLAAVGQVLVPVVPFDGVALVVSEIASPSEDEWCRTYAFHVVNSPNETRTAEEMWRAHAANPPPLRAKVPYEGSDLQRAHNAGLPYACNDLWEKQVWLPHEFRLGAVGVRTYAACPLQVRGQAVGVALFCRGTAAGFTSQDLRVLADVSRPLAVAIANALANKEINRLKEQLEAENISLRCQLGQAPWLEGIVGSSTTLRRALETVEQVAPTDATVLITGETGTGKELIARAIHRRSPRGRGPLVMVNCSAIPETLLASELFGHERGAFTGAVERRKGRFEQAHGGTLFLDEIGEMPPETQVILLRVLQEREFERLGGRDTLRVDVRILAGTNRDLAEHVRAGRFRDDLYYRLNVFPIRMPPLRERREDIPLLVAHFAEKHGRRHGRSIARIDRRTLTLLESYEWPGNVRELENMIERAVILSRNGILRVNREMLPDAGVAPNMETSLQAREKEMIESALRESRGRVAGLNGAAKRLGMAPSTLEFRIRRLGIDRFLHRRDSADK
jgi:formate hydrogenlyase transcriptional activator